MAVTKFNLVVGATCLLIGGLAGSLLQMNVFEPAQNSQINDISLLSERIHNIENKIDLIESRLYLQTEVAEFIILEKGVMGQNYPYTWYLDLEEDTKIVISFRLEYHDLTKSLYSTMGPRFQYWLVKWDPNRYETFWESLRQDFYEGTMFSTERWLEVLGSFDVHEKIYNKEHVLSKGEWVIYIPGTPLVLYEVSVIKK